MFPSEGVVPSRTFKSNSTSVTFASCPPPGSQPPTRTNTRPSLRSGRSPPTGQKPPEFLPTRLTTPDAIVDFIVLKQPVTNRHPVCDSEILGLAQLFELLCNPGLDDGSILLRSASGDRHDHLDEHLVESLPRDRRWRWILGG